MRRPVVLLTLLALIWGASFMLIKIADRQLTPATLILGRLGSAALLLAAIAFGASARGGHSRKSAMPGAGSSSWAS